MRDGEALIRESWRRWNDGLREYDPELLDPQVEIRSALAGETFSGEEGVRGWVTEVDEQFGAWELSIAEIESVSDERFVVRGSVRARGRQSGLDLDQQMTWRVELREGRILRIENVIGWDPE